VKRLVNEGTDAALETALSYEQQTLIALYATADGQESIAAFMEKSGRQPSQATSRRSAS
jgi:enoyl-CoA hydratase/carnithine racemase